MLCLIRHAEAVSGEADPPLTPRGERQARLLAQWLARAGLRFDVAFTSDLRRALSTAGHLRGVVAPGTELRVRPGLREVPSILPPETRALLVAAAEEVRGLARERDVLVVAHAGVIRALLYLYLRVDAAQAPTPRWRFANTGITLLNFEDEATGTVACMNATPHLPAEDWQAVVFPLLRRP